MSIKTLNRPIYYYLINEYKPKETANKALKWREEDRRGERKSQKKDKRMGLELNNKANIYMIN
jgi:hypothetical protein